MNAQIARIHNSGRYRTMSPKQAKTTPELQALKRRMTRLEARMKERPSLKEAPSVMIESRFATTSDASCVTCAERDNQLRSR